MTFYYHDINQLKSNHDHSTVQFVKAMLEWSHFWIKLMTFLIGTWQRGQSNTEIWDLVWTNNFQHIFVLLKMDEYICKPDSIKCEQIQIYQQLFNDMKVYKIDVLHGVLNESQLKCQRAFVKIKYNVILVPHLTDMFSSALIFILDCGVTKLSNRQQLTDLCSSVKNDAFWSPLTFDNHASKSPPAKMYIEINKSLHVNKWNARGWRLRSRCSTFHTAPSSRAKHSFWFSSRTR